MIWEVPRSLPVELPIYQRKLVIYSRKHARFLRCKSTYPANYVAQSTRCFSFFLYLLGCIVLQKRRPHWAAPQLERSGGSLWRLRRRSRWIKPLRRPSCILESSDPTKQYHYASTARLVSMKYFSRIEFHSFLLYTSYKPMLDKRPLRKYIYIYWWKFLCIVYLIRSV